MMDESAPSIDESAAVSASHANGRQPLSMPVFERRQGSDRRGAAGGDPRVAYDKGYAEATAEWTTRLDDEKTKNDRDLNAVYENIRTTEEKLRQEMVQTMARIFSAVAPALARVGALREIEQLLEGSVAPPEDFRITMHPSLAARVTSQLNESPAGQRQNDGASCDDALRIETDETLSETGFNARWANGGMVHDPEALIQKILENLGMNESSEEEK